MDAPTVVVFDVNETLSDMSPMADRFARVGAPPDLAVTWFASLLRDGFALTAAGQQARFADIGRGLLRGMLRDHGAEGREDETVDEAVERVMAGFLELGVHPDVPDGIRAMADCGLRLVTLSNGSASVAEGLLARAGLRDRFEACLSVDDAGRWKPHPDAYAYAAQQCGVRAAEMVLVAVHPWDIDGAHRAGLRTAWVNRQAGPYPEHFSRPDVQAPDLVDLARQLVSG
jgi:2-haloacid dehalogenase